MKTKKKKPQSKISIYDWPHYKNDHPIVTALLVQAENCNRLGWQWSKKNPIASENAFKNGWAFSLAAAWLRTAYDGSLLHAQDKGQKVSTFTVRTGTKGKAFIRRKDWTWQGAGDVYRLQAQGP